MTPTLARALSVARLGLAVLDIEAKDRGEPDGGPAPAPREGRELANPFGLPAGGPIRRTLVRFFRRQLARIFDRLPRDPITEVPAAFDVTDWTDEMTSAMTPVIRPYWDRGGKRLYEEVGLDPKNWEVRNPFIEKNIKEQSFFFCQATNESTTLALEAAHAGLRKVLAEGLVERGESLDWLTREVNKVFDGAKKYRARRIAATEASRAVHLGGLEAARQSEVVKSKRLLLSSDACPICHRVKSREPADGWPIDATMHNDGRGHAYYSAAPCPPLHVSCQCSITYVLDEEFSGG